MNNMITALFSAIQNPGAILGKMGLTADALKDPKNAVQRLVADGRMSQARFNELRSTAQNIAQNPAFLKMMGK